MEFLRALLLLALAASLPAQSPQVRLGDEAEPIRYAVDLTLDPASDSFSGEVVIDIRINEPSQTVRLNSHSLEIDSVSWSVGGRTISGGYSVVDEHNIDFGATQPLSTGEARLTIAYSGRYDTQTTSGLFKLEEGGDPYVFTQFEPYAARYAFPGFDEPRFKTPYRVTLRVPEGVGAFGNAPVESEAVEGGMQVYRFAESKPLPSYLVAFAVGPFDVVDAGKAGANQTPLRILAPRGKGYQAEYASAVTGDILEWLEGYFGIPYPYEKLDSVTLPLTFGFGAMENAGLITYAATLILADPATDSINRQQRYFGVGAHELAHQWFGNLVTPVWWDDIWLNEAFASWMTSKTLSEMKPEWRQDSQRIATRLRVMRQDSLASARQIRQPVEDYGAIHSSFDGITYSKGQSVIHMFETWLGEDDFQKGVQQYLKQYAWRNANVNAFLDSLSTASEKNVTRAFGSFLDQNGIPLVEMSLSCDGGNATLHLEQSRALPLGSEGSRDRTWRVPVCVRYESGGESHRECTLLDSKTADWTLAEAEGCPAWVSPNSGGDGYYYVSYGDGMLEPLLADGGAVLRDEERLSVAGDVRAGFEMGLLPAEAALSLVEALADDPERAVAVEVAQLAAGIRGLLEPEDLDAYREWVREVFGDRARELGWTPEEGEDSETRLLRTTLVPFVANYGNDEELQAEAHELALAWLKDRKAVSGEIVSGVLSAAAATDDAELFDKLLAALKQETDRRDRGRILSALGSFNEPELVGRAFDVVSDDSIDLRESIRALSPMSNDPATREHAVDFVEENYDALVARMPDRGVRSIAATLPRYSSSGCSEEAAERTHAFFEERLADRMGGPRALRETVEGIRLCAALKEKRREALVKGLQTN